MSGEIYFFAVQPNPIHNGSLIALAPIVHRFGGCIGLTLSDDGVYWSPLTPLVRCTVYGDRAAHHPVVGGLIKLSRYTPWLVVEGKEDDEHQRRLMGRYELVPGKWINGRGVWRDAAVWLKLLSKLNQ